MQGKKSKEVNGEEDVMGEEENERKETFPDLDSLEESSLDKKDEVKENKKDELSLDEQLAEINSKYLYAVAELDNARKRHIKERSDLLKYAGESIARDLLEILDDLDRATSQSSSVSSETILEGIGLVANRMKTLFERHGIKNEDCVGDDFDPKKHEALTMAPSSKENTGKILQQISKCYFFKDKLLRPAQVIVGSGEPLEEAETEDNDQNN